MAADVDAHDEKLEDVDSEDSPNPKKSRKNAVSRRGPGRPAKSSVTVVKIPSQKSSKSASRAVSTAASSPPPLSSASVKPQNKRHTKDFPCDDEIFDAVLEILKSDDLKNLSVNKVKSQVLISSNLSNTVLQIFV